MHCVVPALEHDVTGVLLQFMLLPFSTLLLVLEGVPNDTGVVPRREIRKPWQYPPGDGFVDEPTAGIGP